MANVIEQTLAASSARPAWWRNRLLLASAALLTVPLVCFVLALVLFDGAPLKPISSGAPATLGAAQSNVPPTRLE